MTSEVVSDPTTPDLRVLAPDGEGPWPVVVALHGFPAGEQAVEVILDAITTARQTTSG